MVDLLLQIQDEAEIVKKENILIKQAAIIVLKWLLIQSVLIIKENRILNIKKILAADDDEDEDL